MNDIVDLTDTERRILAVLEEAGEDDFCALINTMMRCVGDEHETRDMIGALISLERRGLVEFATSRDEQTLEWLPLTRKEAMGKLSELPLHLTWSVDNLYWQWISMDKRLDVLVTPAGHSMAEEILRRYGWDMTGPA